MDGGGNSIVAAVVPLALDSRNVGVAAPGRHSSYLRLASLARETAVPKPVPSAAGFGGVRGCG